MRPYQHGVLFLIWYFQSEIEAISVPTSGTSHRLDSGKKTQEDRGGKKETKEFGSSPLAPASPSTAPVEPALTHPELLTLSVEPSTTPPTTVGPSATPSNEPTSSSEPSTSPTASFETTNDFCATSADATYRFYAEIAGCSDTRQDEVYIINPQFFNFGNMCSQATSGKVTFDLSFDSATQASLSVDLSENFVNDSLILKLSVPDTTSCNTLEVVISDSSSTGALGVEGITVDGTFLDAVNFTTIGGINGIQAFCINKNNGGNIERIIAEIDGQDWADYTNMRFSIRNLC